MASRPVRAIPVAAQERDIRPQGQAAGGKWNKEGVWELPDGQGVRRGPTERIVSQGNVDK